MTYKEEIEELIKYYKTPNQMMETILIISNKEDDILGLLVPITYDYKLYHPYLPRLLGEWRRKNPSLSMSQFKITVKNTTYWLDKLVLGRSDRLLFMINTLDGKPIGHIGYSSFNFEEKSAEIDCVLRGVPSPIPKLMARALNRLLQFGNEQLRLKNIYLSTAKDNTKSINLYTNCGFKIIKDIPVFKHVLPNGEIRWDEDATKDPTTAERFGVYMKYMKE